MTEQPQNSEQPNEDIMTPFNDVERAIVEGSEGKLSNNDVLAKIASSSLFFLSTEKIEDKTQNVMPLILKGPEEQHFLALFTHPERVAQQFIDSAPYAVSIPGAEAFKQAGSLGVAINPGHPIGLMLDASNVSTIQGLLADEPEGQDPAGA
ncbi:MAG: SseB family protein [Galactobacter sp.]|uniref:SseB family protein n=1 Tax=Galactobacter sp. TaxID=2676125 RepID=UPI0025C332DC|nr:SseB family protein [Galactobacter sp.]